MAEYIVNLDCSEPIREGDVNAILVVHDKIERIVRCKDCKHGGFNDNMHNGFCDAFSGHILWIEPDGFCAWGERRDDA